MNSYLPYYRTTLRLALPVVLTQLGAGLVGLADTIMVGHVDANSLAAVSFANSIFVIGLVAAMGVAMAITPLVGQHYARGEKSAITSIFGNGTLFTLLSGAVISGLMLALLPAMDYMGQDAEVIRIAKPYYIIQVISLLPFLIFTCEKQLLEGLGNTRSAMWVSMISIVVNIILNYILIYGKLGFTPYGALGAAIASLIARTISPAILTVVIKRNEEWWNYIKTFSLKQIKWESLKEIAIVGLPIGGQSVLECMSFSLSCIMVGWLGAVPLASHEIACQLSNITWMGIMGVGSATVIRVSHLYGARDYESMHRCAIASIHIALVYECITSLLLITLNRYIPYIFSNDAAVLTTAPLLIICCGLYQISDGMQVIGLSILRGMTDVRRPVVYSLISYIFLCLPIGYILITHSTLGAVGVWIGFITSLTTVAILVLTRYRRLYKSLNLTTK